MERRMSVRDLVAVLSSSFDQDLTVFVSTENEEGAKEQHPIEATDIRVGVNNRLVFETPPNRQPVENWTGL